MFPVSSVRICSFSLVCSQLSLWERCDWHFTLFFSGFLQADRLICNTKDRLINKKHLSCDENPCEDVKGRRGEVVSLSE